MSLKYRKEITNLCNIAEFWNVNYGMNYEEDIEGEYRFWYNDLYYRDNKVPNEKQVHEKVLAARERSLNVCFMLSNDFGGLKKIIMTLDMTPIYICHPTGNKIRTEITTETRITYKNVMEAASNLLKYTWNLAIRKYGGFDYIGDEDGVPVFQVHIVTDRAFYHRLPNKEITN
jgi:hypothetical protein